MAHEAPPDSSLAKALKDLFGDVSDLLRKEVRLAKAEITSKITAGIEAGAWMAAAGLLALAAALLVVQALVFFIASFGIAMHWACLIVALLLVTAAGALFFYGRSVARGSFRPARTLDQINKDINVVRST